jgi:hypothetical protein
MKRVVLVMAALVAAICVFAGLTLPPRRLSLAPFDDGTIAGILHVHTTRSDGRGTPDEVAAAAARAGVSFIVFTDHGDATRTPDAPAYRSGVLCLDGVEISTSGGHYVALDMPAAPYPLAGEARAVVDDVRRLGGFGIVAHPDSPKPELRWSDWEAPIDGVEWINPDTSWRVHAVTGWRSRFRLLEGLLHYPIRPAETLAGLLTGFEDTMARWTELAGRRPIVGVAGVDGHAKLEFRDSDPGDNRFSIPLPNYEASFRMLSVHVTPERPLSRLPGDAAADAALVMRAIRAGHLYTAIDGLATPPAFEFSATNERGTAQQGDELGVGGPVSLHVRSNAPPGFTTVIWRGSEMLTSEPRNEVSIEAGAEPAVYRAEVRTDDPDRPRTWLLGNAVYVRAPRPVQAAPQAPVTLETALFDGRTDSGWHLETDPLSLAAVDVGATVSGFELRYRYALAGDSAAGTKWAALVWGTPIGHAPVHVDDFDRLTFTARAERPMRISVQLRTLETGRELRRWQRSVFLDSFDREHTVYFKDLVPSAGTDPGEPALDQVSQILFVVDTTNTKPGTSGRIWIRSAAFQKEGSWLRAQGSGLRA